MIFERIQLKMVRDTYDGDTYYSPDNLCHILPGGMKNILLQGEMYY